MKKDLTLLKKLNSDGIPVVSVFISGRPMWVNAELNASDAFVAVWLPGSEGKAIADQIVNRHDEDYSPLLPYGFGLRYGDKNVLTDDLSEVLPKSSQSEQPLVLFNGQVQAPWQMNLFDSSSQTVITSSSQSLAGIDFRTTDRLVQEDVIKLTFKGKNLSGIRLVSANGFREDMSSYLESDSVIMLSVNRGQSTVDELNITLSCEDDGDEPSSCSGQMSLTELVNNIPVQQWQDLAVKLSCFAQQGVEFDKVVMPF